MCGSLWRLACVLLLSGSSLGCYQCFVADLAFTLTSLCSGHVLDQSGVANIDACFKKVENAFDGNKDVIEAARVGAIVKFIFCLWNRKFDLTLTSLFVCFLKRSRL